ncbi:MAG: hypothetical protein A2V70_02110 [Planctomycetes bacterium RBG_13_63_9]|nr:MAG: hypothetical protein A2V70_02110 [Planctomycetes bacterium RBG_13_63_9]
MFAVLNLMKRAKNRLLGRLTRIVLGVMPSAHRNKVVERSLWTGAPILNMAVNARAERLLGVKADSLVYNTYFITDQFTYNLSRASRVPLLRVLVPYLTLIWACRRYQRFHFYCDAGMLTPGAAFQFNPEELRLLQDLGKQVFFWTYGADVRTRRTTLSLGEPNCCTQCPAPGKACICDEHDARVNQARIRATATAVFAMGDMTEYTPGSRNDLFFWPVDLGADGGRKYAPHYPPLDGDRPIRIVHAPNHRHFKGTDHLLDAVRRLQAEGHAVELTLVERVPNDQALEMYRSADVVFDQCLIGFHGYFAVEAMAMGKPVVCYIRKPDDYLLAPDECPIQSARADQVEAVLRELIEDRHRLHELGVQGRRYVEKYFTLEAFAARLRRAYDELLPREGSCDSPTLAGDRPTTAGDRPAAGSIRTSTKRRSSASSNLNSSRAVP